MKSYSSWTICTMDDGKKVLADNHGIIMDKSAAYEAIRSILDFYEGVTDAEILVRNKQTLKENLEGFEMMIERNEKHQEREREYKPTYMFIIKKVNEPCYKFKYGGYRERNLMKIQKQLDLRLDNLEKESEVPIELVSSFIYVHNAPGIYRNILETYGSFRDEFDWYVLEDKFLNNIIKDIKNETLDT
ncbi:TPA: hypothetical protein ROY30_005222 [Bacillus cereus]|uniref:hypothetical protein n=1 Tax=Bacillus sp. 1663tsa1 TaxID=2953804 RepID=UPI00209E032D|nr:hypothetical protein [Bacillus sp. 1663tsa1]MCP1181287.1 hypothetical protein [Bacillus sp. 1663tsa1]MCU5751591.1 hypothetical protein [Bacillus cereus]HDX9631470.1 hypothetical protein [Bacillus cereus]